MPSDTFNESLNMIAGPGGGVAPQPVAAASSPSLLASLPGWVNPALGMAGVAGTAIEKFIAAKQAEKARRDAKRMAEEQLALQKRAQNFQEQQWSDGTTQRAMNVSNSAFPAINANMDWRERIGVLSRGS